MPRAQACEVCQLGITDVNTSWCWVEDFDLPTARETQDYSASGAAGQDPYDYLGEQYDDAPWSISWVVKGDTPAELAANINTLQRLLFHGQKLTWRDGGMDQTMYTWLRTTHPLQIKYHGAFARCTGSGTRQYDWWGTQRDDAAVPVAAGMAYVDVADPGGELPAATMIRSTWDQATTMIAVGVIPNPQTGLNVIHEYTGVADAGARDGYVAELSMTNSLQTIGTPPTLDKEVHRGRWVVLARIKSDAATASNTKYAGISTITGSGMSSSQSVVGVERAGTVTAATGLEVVVLGEFSVPAAFVPNVDTGTGFAAEVNNSNYTSATDLVAFDTGNGYNGFYTTETISDPVRHRGATIKVKENAGIARTLTAYLLAASSNLPTGSHLVTATVSVPANHNGTVRVNWSVDIPAGSYCVAFKLLDGTSASTLQIYVDKAAGNASNVGGTYFAPDAGSPAWMVGRFADAVTTLIQQTSAPSESGSWAAIWQSITLSTPARITALGMNLKTPTHGAVDAIMADSAGTDIRPSGSAARLQRVSGTKAMVVADIKESLGTGAAHPITLATGSYRIEYNSYNSDDRYGYSGSNPYAGGQASTSSSHDVAFQVDGYAQANVDLYVKTHIQYPLGFNASIGVQARCSESSRTAKLDAVCLIPEPCVVVTGSFGAGEGVMIDNLQGLAALRNIYRCNIGGGSGASLIDTAERYGVLLLQPGVTNRVVVCAYTPVGSVPGDGDLVVTTVQRFLSRSRAA